MTMRVAIRCAVCAIALAPVVALTGATLARAQGATGAGTTGSVSPSQPAAKSAQAAPDSPSPQVAQSSQANLSSADSSSLPAAANSNVPLPTDVYEPIDASGRVMWVLQNTVQPLRILGDGVFAGVQTGIDSPHEYGPHWDGFGKRLGIDLAGAAVSNTMEAGLGAFWGEDPRYARVGEGGFRSRTKSVVKQTFVARGRDGEFHPAYARYIAIPSSNWLSNTWRADSAANNKDAAIRTAWGFGSRMASNAYVEFGPDVKRHIFHHDQ